MCGICGEEPETIDHALLHCKKVSLIWYMSPLRMDLSKDREITFKELLWTNMDKQPPEITSLIAFMAWEIWNARNKVYFENKNLDVLSVIQRAQNGFREFADQLWDVEKPISTRPKQREEWEKPEAGRLKCNCDVAVRKDGIIGMGFVVRDANGDVLLAAKGEMGAEGGTTLLEGLAMRYAMQMIKQYNMIVDYVESDNLPLIESLLGKMKPEVYADVVIQDINQLARCTGNPKFRHIPRQANKVAHHMACGLDFISIKHVPNHVRLFIESDVIVG